MEVIAGFAGEPATVLITLAVILISTLVHCLLRVYLGGREIREPQEEPHPVAVGPLLEQVWRGDRPPPPPVPVLQPKAPARRPPEAAPLIPPPPRNLRAPLRHDPRDDHPPFFALSDFLCSFSRSFASVGNERELFGIMGPVVSSIMTSPLNLRLCLEDPLDLEDWLSLSPEDPSGLEG